MRVVDECDILPCTFLAESDLSFKFQDVEQSQNSRCQSCLCQKLPQKLLLDLSPSRLFPFHHHPHSFVFLPPHGVSGRRRPRPPSPHPCPFPRAISLQLPLSQIYPHKRRSPHPLGHIACRGRRDRFERRLWRATQSRGQGIHIPFAYHT